MIVAAAKPEAVIATTKPEIKPAVALKTSPPVLKRKRKRKLAATPVEIPIVESVTDIIPEPGPPYAKASDENKESAYGILRITPKIYFSSIQASDVASLGTAQFQSDINYGVNIKFEQVWLDRWHSYFAIEMDQEKFIPPVGRTVFNLSQHRLGIGIGIERNLTSRFSVGASIFYKQELFVRAVDLNNLAIEKTPITQAALGVTYRILDSHPISLEVKAGGLYYFPGKTDFYSIHSGYGYYADIGAVHEMGRTSLSANTKLQKRFQDTSIIKQTNAELSFEFSINKRF
jgi:hypothetical protein